MTKNTEAVKVAPGPVVGLELTQMHLRYCARKFTEAMTGPADVAACEAAWEMLEAASLQHAAAYVRENG